MYKLSARDLKINFVLSALFVLTDFVLMWFHYTICNVFELHRYKVANFTSMRIAKICFEFEWGCKLLGTSLKALLQLWSIIAFHSHIYTTCVSHAYHMAITCTPNWNHMPSISAMPVSRHCLSLSYAHNLGVASHHMSHAHHMGITCTPHGYHKHTTWGVTWTVCSVLISLGSTFCTIAS